MGQAAELRQGVGRISPRARAVASWALTGLLSLTYVSTGVGKLAHVPPSPENFARWGFSMGFMHWIGTIEMVGAIGLLFTRIAPVAALGLMAMMLGAIQTGIPHGEGMHIVLPAGLIVLLAIHLRARHNTFGLGRSPWRNFWNATSKKAPGPTTH